MAKSITLLGSTGSIGTQSLDVARSQGYEVRALAANSSVDKLLEQIEEFHPRYVAVADPAACQKLKGALAGRANAPKVLEGAEGIVTLAGMGEADVVLNAVVGIAGLGATLAALESGCDVALANKESLVTGGYLVTKAAESHNAKLLPVDSEHSAIFQCLQDAHSAKALTKILLTASGGPFFGMKKEELAGKTKADALKHPNWNMGAKITIDSATLMNKGLELIEAVWLFGLPPEKVQVVVQRQSIIHSMVQFSDNSILAQLGVPDMRIPIQYALTWPERAPGCARNLISPPSSPSPSMWRTRRPSAALPPAKRPSPRAALAPAPPTAPTRRPCACSWRTRSAFWTSAVWWRQWWTATPSAAATPSPMCTSVTAWPVPLCKVI